MSEVAGNQVEIDLKRLLHRLQGSLSSSSHSSSSEEEVTRRWTFVKHGQKLLQELQTTKEKKNNTEEHEDRLRRISNYENKLSFIIQLMNASEGHRPLIHTTNSIVPIISTSLDEEKEDDSVLQKQAISIQEDYTRKSLFVEERNLRVTENDLRQRLGLVPSNNKTGGKKILNSTQELEEDEKIRDEIAENILGLLANVTESLSHVQNTLQSEASQLNEVSSLVDKNIGNTQTEVVRTGAISQATSRTCRTNCYMILFVFAVWISLYVLMKITPRPN